MLGLQELVMRQEWFHFIGKHKLFALELYGYYKPQMLISSWQVRLQQISPLCLIYCAMVSLLSGFLLIREKLQPFKLMMVATFFMLASCLPSFVAYAAMSSASDDLWMFAIYICLGISMLAYTFFSWIQRNIKNVSH